MPKVYSVINFKGGVCKTTLAVNIAAALANYPRPDGNPFRVLLVDIDPQANASVYMLGEEYWKNEIQNKSTISPNLYRVLKDQINGKPINYDFILKPDSTGYNPIFGDRKIKKTDGTFETKKAKQNWSNLHLISAINSLFDLPKEHGYDKKFANNHNSLLDDLLKTKYNEYDYIIIDCPTHFSPLTQNAISVSTDIIVPFVPDYLSTFGMNELFSRISSLADENKKSDKLKIAVVIPTLYSDISNEHNFFVKQVQDVIKDKRKSQRILKSTSIIWPGFKRTINVSNLIKDHRPIIDLPTSNESRKTINFILKAILSPEKRKRTKL